MLVKIDDKVPEVDHIIVYGNEEASMYIETSDGRTLTLVGYTNVCIKQDEDKIVIELE